MAEYLRTGDPMALEEKTEEWHEVCSGTRSAINFSAADTTLHRPTL